VGHLQGSGADVHAIEKGDHIKDKQKGQDPARDAMAGALRYVGRWFRSDDRGGD
jgi:hypothetical protein